MVAATDDFGLFFLFIIVHTPQRAGFCPRLVLTASAHATDFFFRDFSVEEVCEQNRLT